MWLYLLILTIAITGFFALAMGLKLIFEKNASIDGPSCEIDATSKTGNPACAACKIKEIANCDENPAFDRKLKTI